MSYINLADLSANHLKGTRDAQRVLAGLQAIAKRLGVAAISEQALKTLQDSQRLQLEFCLDPDLTANKLLRQRVLMRLPDEAGAVPCLDLEQVFEDATG